MARITANMRKVIAKCKKSPIWFIENFCEIVHPTAGRLPFKLFSYQQQCIRDFRNPDLKYCLFHKVRQSGISTLCGAYALWYVMFQTEKSVLIVSKTDEDAKIFLRRNVRYLYDMLPQWMRDIWTIDPNKGGNSNTHEMFFPNGSRISSLTSSPNVMRGQSVALFIIDEAAFIRDMDSMWTSAAPILSHGGSCIIVSTPSGMGNFYWRTVRGAQNGTNEFHLIQIDWHDMDWVIEYDDAHGIHRRIAPTDGLRPCTTPEEIEKYGQYVSPWLEEQYRKLASDGDDKKFRQEILHEFLGTGDTVVPRKTLVEMNKNILANIEGQRPSYKSIGRVQYKNPVTETEYLLNFANQLWLWQPPFKGDQDQGLLPHNYVLGADASPGEGEGDPSAVVVFDLDTLEQVAELSLRVDTLTFSRMVDYIGRSYNNAMAVVERDAWGSSVIQRLNIELCYPNIYRHVKERINLTKVNERYGFPATVVGKTDRDTNMVQCLGEHGGFMTRSERLVREAEIYIHLNASRTGAEPGPGNHDDLITACGLALIGIKRARQMNNQFLIPIDGRSMQDLFENMPAVIDPNAPSIQTIGGKDCLAPMPHRVQGAPSGDMAAQIAAEIMRFAGQLGAMPTHSIPHGGVVNPRRYPKLKRK